MSKKKFYYGNLGIPVAFDKMNYERIIVDKIFTWYASRFDFPTLDYQASHYIKRVLFFNGQIAELPLKDSLPKTAIFTKFAPTSFNTYDFPISVTLINKKNLKDIPSTPQLVDRDVVLWYAQRNHRSIVSLLQDKIDRLTEIEMSISINLQAVKTPFLIEITPENRKAVEEMVRSITGGELVIFVPTNVTNTLKVVNTGANYLVDKLIAARDKVECEIKEFLGINSLPLNEKKEHLITSEIDSNNEITEYNGDSLLEPLKEASKNSSLFLGIDIPVKVNKIDRDFKEESNEEEEEVEDVE